MAFDNTAMDCNHTNEIIPMTTTADKTKALRAELASLRAEKDRLAVMREEAAYDHLDTADLQAKIATAASRIDQIEGALRAAARRVVKDTRAADQAKVKEARAALVSAGKEAAAKGLAVQKAADALAVALNDFTATLEGPNFVALRTLNELRGDRDREPVAVNYSLHPVLKSTAQAVIANLMFRVGIKQAEASGFVVDVPGVVNQSIPRLLNAFDDDVARLPCFRPEGEAASVVSDDIPGQGPRKRQAAAARDPGCFPAEEITS